MFWNRKPKAIIVISRQTGSEEAASVTVNAFKLDRVSIYKALTEAGEALTMRLMDHNKIAQEIGKEVKVVDPTKLTSVPKGKNK